MAEQAVGVVIGATTSPESKGGLEHTALLGGESVGGDLRLGEPTGTSVVRGRHEKSSPESRPGGL